MKKQNKVKCVCERCNLSFERFAGEVNRKKKLKTPFYCSRECSAAASMHKTCWINGWSYSKENAKHLQKQCSNRKDEYTPYKELLRRTKQRANRTNNLDLPFIKEMWERQNGKCCILGHDLVLPQYNSKVKNHNTLASIDRIDSKKGYTKDNVRIVCASINYAKNRFDDYHLFEFIGLCKKSQTI